MKLALVGSSLFLLAACATPQATQRTESEPEYSQEMLLGTGEELLGEALAKLGACGGRRSDFMSRYYVADENRHILSYRGTYLNQLGVREVRGVDCLSASNARTFFGSNSKRLKGAAIIYFIERRG